MKAVCLHDKAKIESFLQQNPLLHIYALGDLDDFFWPHTSWYGLVDERGIQELVLVYSGTKLPVILALAEGPAEPMHQLLHAILHILPRRLYTHLSPGLEPILAQHYELQSHGRHHKMALTEPARLEGIDTSKVDPLSPAELPDLHELYRTSYPDNWFDPRMLETGQYFGLRKDGVLVSVAGIHVYSPSYRVAALGNVTTHPAYRGQGLGTIVSARLCQSLLRTVDHIGLNVRADNAAAIACYDKLGFSWVADYEEYMLEVER